MKLALIHSCLIFALTIGVDALAAPINKNNLLVTSFDNGTLTEYTRSGQAVQSFQLPDFSGGFHDLRGVTQGTDGLLHMYNGTFTPRLSTLDARTGQVVSNLSLAGWSTVNNISYGGIARNGSSVFATDMMTYGGGEASGIVAFDLQSGQARRFANGREYTDLSMGKDGLLYATNGYSIDVYDPHNSNWLRSVQLQGYADVRGISVDQRGQIFTADWNGWLSKFSTSGQLLGHTYVGNNLTDIDLGQNGELVAGSRFGDVFLTDSNFSQVTSFHAGNNSWGPTLHVAFAAAPVPEPETWALFGIGLLGVAAFVKRRQPL